MEQFCFYYGEEPVLAARVRAAAQSAWGEVTEVAADSFRLFVATADLPHTVADSPEAVGAVAGYVRCDHLAHAAEAGSAPDQPHNRRFLATVAQDGGWPLGSEWTGSFAAVAYSRGGRELFLCNDPIGYIPLYYSQVGDGLIGGTSLIVLSHCRQCEVDVTGLLQGITNPFCFYGRRTLLQPVSRLLPGERLQFSPKARTLTSSFDNSLCNGMLDGDVDAAARAVWDCVCREIALAAGIADRTCVALSGGWDSRLVLRGLAHRGETLDCYTYGGDDLYESGVARACAAAVGARHRCFTIEDHYFPSRSSFEQIVRETEAGNIPEWYGLLDGVKVPPGEPVPILVGDHLESIDGRNMAELQTRAARTRAFLQELVGKRDPIPAATLARFAEWKRRKQEGILREVLASIERLSPALAALCEEERVREETVADLELSFRRVEENMPPFAPMFDELFWWFHGSRYARASQNLMVSSRFRAFSPVMSLRALRLISTVHPRLRMRRRLMTAISRLPDFDRLARIPSAETPWVGARAPAVLRDLVWGFRSTLDKKLMKRVMRRRNERLRQRVLPFLNYLREYRRDGTVPAVESWFSGAWLRGEAYVDLARSRANFTAWPLINVDIAAPANASILLDLCDLPPAGES